MSVGKGPQIMLLVMNFAKDYRSQPADRAAPWKSSAVVRAPRQKLSCFLPIEPTDSATPVTMFWGRSSVVFVTLWQIWGLKVKGFCNARGWTQSRTFITMHRLHFWGSNISIWFWMTYPDTVRQKIEGSDLNICGGPLYQASRGWCGHTCYQLTRHTVCKRSPTHVTHTHTV